MNNFNPDQPPQRRADMDGGWTFDELCIVGALAFAALCLAVMLFMPMTVSWK